MGLDEKQVPYIPRNNSFYRRYYAHILIGLITLVFLLIIAVGVILYQITHRPLPVFHAMQPNGNRMLLTPYDEPNLLPDTILRWVSKAATVSYTFDYVNYKQQLLAARPYFTDAGWQDYLLSVENLVNTIVQNQLFINGVVAGTPVISNQGDLPGKGYTWRIQIPFLVVYQSANTTSKRRFYVIITVVRVPTNINPQGIGIDQFVMV